MSFAIVVVAFALSHRKADWPAALVTGVLYNLVTCRSKSLTSCVVTHALTNLALGSLDRRNHRVGFW